MEKLCPPPKKVYSFSGEDFFVRRSLSISVDEKFQTELKIEVLESFIEKNLEVSLVDDLAENVMKVSIIHVEQDEKPTSYYKLMLKNDSCVVIECSTPVAGFYGCHTFFQVLRLGNVSCLTIEDWSDIPNRGVMLDISRDRVPKLGTIFHFVDQLSSLKYNEFQLYCEHTFAYPGHDFWKGSSPITPEEMKLIDIYCRERFIRLVPNQNSLAHMHRVIKHERYLHLAEKPVDIVKKKYQKHYDHAGKPGFSLCPTDPETTKFLFGLYDSLLSCVDDCATINIGLDESRDLGTWNTRSTSKCKETSVGEVYVQFLETLTQYLVEKKGVREVQFWADMIEGFHKTRNRIPSHCVPIIWWYEGRSKFFTACPMASEISKNNFYVCPSSSSWNTFASRTTNYIDNVSGAAEQGFKHGCKGFLLSIWGDNGHMQCNEVSLGAVVGGSCVSWNVETAKYDENDPLNTKLREMIVNGLNLHIFKDESESIGTIMTSLGDCYRLVKEESRCGGCSELFNLLVFDGEAPGMVYMKGMTSESIHRTMEHIKKHSQKISSIKLEIFPHNNSNNNNDSTFFTTTKIMKRKLIWISRIQMFSCHVGLEFMKLGEERKIKMRKWRVQDFPENAKRRMKVELEEIIEEFKFIWLLDSRPGGLSDSVARLKHFLLLLEVE